MTFIYIQKNSKVSLVLVNSSVCGARNRFAPTHSPEAKQDFLIPSPPAAVPFLVRS